MVGVRARGRLLVLPYRVTWSSVSVSRARLRGARYTLRPIVGIGLPVCDRPNGERNHNVLAVEARVQPFDELVLDQILVDELLCPENDRQLKSTTYPSCPESSFT
jgi:hypothetical protein